LIAPAAPDAAYPDDAVVVCIFRDIGGAVNIAFART
jgi:hypothetical protein